MWDCIKCKVQNSDEDMFCTECGTIKANVNYCGNKECEAYKVLLNKPDQKYCGKCGGQTIYTEGKAIIASVEIKDPIKEAEFEDGVGL